MIYYDITESRVGTRLSDKVVEVGKPVIGLERETGADLLISAAEGVLPGNVLHPPGSLLLNKYLSEGMLVQRKSGMDLLGSIPDLTNIIVRMRSVPSKMNWLLVCGKYWRSPQGFVSNDGHQSKWQWDSFQGALDAWQMMGGLLHMGEDDDDCAQWILRWDAKLKKTLLGLDREIYEKPIVPKLGLIDPHPQRSTLMTLPGCGDVLSIRIMEKCGTLASAIEWLTQEEPIGVHGVGKEKVDGWRKWLGLKEGQVMGIMGGEPTFHE